MICYKRVKIYHEFYSSEAFIDARCGLRPTWRIFKALLIWTRSSSSQHLLKLAPGEALELDGRWRREASSQLRVVEMAWMMGYIKHFDGCLRWVDSKNDKPADDKDVRGRYKKEILTYAGVRLNGES